MSWLLWPLLPVLTLTATWVIARAAYSTFRVSKRADYERREAGRLRHFLRRGKQRSFYVDGIFPIDWWWRPAEAVRWNRDVHRFVGVAFLLDPTRQDITQTLLINMRRRNAPEVFAAVRDLIGVTPDAEVSFTRAHYFGLAVMGEDFMVFIWRLDEVPKRWQK